MSKNWDFAPEPSARMQELIEETRKQDFHLALTEEESEGRAHEALQKMADLLVDATEDFMGRVIERGSKDGSFGKSQVEALEHDVLWHVRRVSVVLVKEAVDRLQKKRVSGG